MDGYLDQQVPYTLANVRMDKATLFKNTLHYFMAWLPGFLFRSLLHECC